MVRQYYLTGQQSPHLSNIIFVDQPAGTGTDVRDLYDFFQVSGSCVIFLFTSVLFTCCVLVGIAIWLVG